MNFLLLFSQNLDLNKNTHTQPKMISAVELSKLSDNDLFKLMKQAGMEMGPITATTRSVYEKKYAKYLKEKKIPMPRVTLERIDKSYKLTNKTTSTTKSANTQTTIESQINDDDDDDQNDDLIITREEKNKALLNPAHEDNRARHVHYEDQDRARPPVIKQKPKFEFKLLKDNNDSSLNDTYETNLFKSNIERGIRQTQQYTNYFNPPRHYDDTILETTTNKLTNRKPFFQQQVRLTQPILKSTSPLDSAPFRNYDYGYQPADSSSLYNQQPPPFHTQYQQSKAVISEKETSWVSAICSNIKYCVLLFLVVFVVYTFLSYLQSFNDENPIVD